MTPQLAERPGGSGGESGGGRDADVDRALADLYRKHYRSLVRLAALLVRDVTTAEKLVQDSFVAMHSRWHRLSGSGSGSERALSYLRESVVNRSRLVRPWAAAQDQHAPGPRPDRPDRPGGEHGEHAAVALLERSAIVAALATLPRRQREALVLCYYGNLSPSQVAAAMRTSEAAVRGHTARAMTALQGVLAG
jgi:RNA polymerase sigma factor (sigma-70 family)